MIEEITKNFVDVNKNFSEMTNIFERLLYLVEVFTNNSQTKFAKSIDCLQATFNGYMNEEGQKKIRLTLLQDIMKRYPSINRNWLYFGEGEPLSKDMMDQRKKDIDALIEENDALKVKLSEEISFSRKLSKQNAELYDKCRMLEEKLSFLEETKLVAPLPPDAPGSQAGKKLNMLNDESKNQ